MKFVNNEHSINILNIFNFRFDVLKLISGVASPQTRAYYYSVEINSVECFLQLRDGLDECLVIN